MRVLVRPPARSLLRPIVCLRGHKAATLPFIIDIACQNGIKSHKGTFAVERGTTSQDRVRYTRCNYVRVYFSVFRCADGDVLENCTDRFAT